MRGRARAAELQNENAYFSAWAAQRFAREKLLKPFGRYLHEVRPKKPQTGAEVLAVMCGLQSHGAKMKISKKGV